jgi:hypothetical protein
MLKHAIAAGLACVLLAATGCETMHSSWKGTKKLYKEYVNVDPAIDLKDPGISDPSLRKLAVMFTPVDEHLEYLLRAFTSQDAPPDPQWCQSFLQNYPWLSGLAILDESGNETFKLPSFSMKTIDYSPLQAFDKLYKARKMAAVVVPDELGAEVLLARPLYVDNNYKGLLVVHFDPGSLAKFSPDPDQLIMLAPGLPAWAGKNEAAAKSLAGLNWKDILKGNVSGELTQGGVRYVWQTRYLAQVQLVYMVEATAADKAKPAQPAQSAQPAQPEPQAAPAQ